MNLRLIKVPPQTVDDYGDAVKLREAFAPTERLYQKLRADLVAHCEDAKPTQEFLVEGERYTLRISPCSPERTVDVVAARKKLGVEKFLEACTITLKALGDLLSKPDVDALTITTLTGARKFTVTPIVSIEDAPKKAS